MILGPVSTISIDICVFVHGGAEVMQARGMVG